MQAILLSATLASCCPAPAGDSAVPEPPPNWVYLYARLYESQPKETAEDQYLPNLREALAGYESKLMVEEITGLDGEIEFIGVDFQVAAPASEAEKLESLLMDAFRLSGAPYATQILIYTP